MRHLGRMFGLGEVASGDVDGLLQIGPDMGWGITQFEETFPDYNAMLDILGWTDNEKLERTFPTACYNQACLSGVHSNYQSRHPIQWPSGRFYINSELRSGCHRNLGEGSTYAFTVGGTQLNMTETDWKSIHGAQNDGVKVLYHAWNYAGENNATAHPIAIGGGSGWCHDFTVEDMRLVGPGWGNYLDQNNIHIGIMYHVPGENSGPRFIRNDGFTFATLVSRAPARCKILGQSAFGNHIAQVGIRGCAKSQINIEDCSGDLNPYVVFMYRDGTDLFGNGPFLPNIGSGNPGGNITMSGFKTETYCADLNNPDHWPGGGVSANNPGKGQMLGRFTGRFHVTITSPFQNSHNGKIDSLMEVIDDFDMGWGGIPLDNSSIRVIAADTFRADHWLHDWKRGNKWVRNTTDGDNHMVDFFWQDNYNSGVPVHPFIPGHTYVNSTPGGNAWKGRQPYINEAQWQNNPPDFPLTWDHTAQPDFNQDVITGNYW